MGLAHAYLAQPALLCRPCFTSLAPCFVECRYSNRLHSSEQSRAEAMTQMERSFDERIAQVYCGIVSPRFVPHLDPSLWARGHRLASCFLTCLVPGVWLQANAHREAALRAANDRAEALLQEERDRHNESMHSLEQSFSVRYHSYLLGLLAPCLS